MNDLSGQPLGELKQWLAISTTSEDALLLRLLETAREVCFRFTGLDPVDWIALDSGLRHGIVRFAAHAYRERDQGGDTAIPSAVAALWRPWRRMKL